MPTFKAGGGVGGGGGGGRRGGLHLLGGTQLALQVFDLFLRLTNAPQGILVCDLLALPPIPLLQLPDAAPEFIDL